MGDVDESAHNSVDALKTSKPCDTELDPEQKAEWEEKIRNAQEYADTARRESEAMTQRLEAAQKKQTAQEFVQRSYVASQLTALKAILSKPLSKFHGSNLMTLRSRKASSFSKALHFHTLVGGRGTSWQILPKESHRPSITWSTKQ